MINLRDAKVEDAQDVLRLIHQMVELEGDISPLTSAYVAHYIVNPNSHILLADQDGQVVGLISYSIRPDLYHAADCCLIQELVVDEAYRSQGIGGQLLEALLSRMQSRGVVEVSLGVGSDNVDAIRFYQAHGISEQAVLLEKHYRSGDQ